MLNGSTRVGRLSPAPSRRKLSDVDRQQHAQDEQCRPPRLAVRRGPASGRATGRVAARRDGMLPHTTLARGHRLVRASNAARLGVRQEPRVVWPLAPIASAGCTIRPCAPWCSSGQRRSSARRCASPSCRRRARAGRDPRCASASAACAEPTCTSSRASWRRAADASSPATRSSASSTRSVRAARASQPGSASASPGCASTCGVCERCRRGDENLCEQARFTGYDADGGYAEYAVVREDFAYALPDAHRRCRGRAAAVRRHHRLPRPAPRRDPLRLPARALRLRRFGAHRDPGRPPPRLPRLRHDPPRRSTAAWPPRSAPNGPAAPTRAPPEKLDSAVLFAPAGTLVPAALAALDRGGTLALAGIYLSAGPAARLRAPSLLRAHPAQRHGQHPPRRRGAPAPRRRDPHPAAHRAVSARRRQRRAAAAQARRLRRRGDLAPVGGAPWRAGLTSTVRCPFAGTGRPRAAPTTRCVSLPRRGAPWRAGLTSTVRCPFAGTGRPRAVPTTRCVSLPRRGAPWRARVRVGSVVGRGTPERAQPLIAAAVPAVVLVPHRILLVVLLMVLLGRDRTRSPPRSA